MLDVPWVLDWDDVCRLETHLARPGYACDPVGPFPFRRKLVEAVPGEYPPEDEFSCLKSAWAYVVVVVALQSLLVPSCSKRGVTVQPLEQQQVVTVDVL